MSDVILKKWKGVVWTDNTIGGYIAFCPKHRLRLEIWDSLYGKAFAQEQTRLNNQAYLFCPEDNEQFQIFGSDFASMARRYGNYQESIDLKDARVYDLDNVYTPVLKVAPKPKDKRFSIQVEVDTTPQGKKLVIYAADRNQNGKTQIFIDPQSDKISFDSNDVHPNTIFSKVEAYFKDGKKAVLEDRT